MQVDRSVKDPPNSWSKFGEIYVDHTFRAVFVCSKCAAEANAFTEVFIAYDVTTLWEHIGERHADNLGPDEATEVCSNDEWDDSEVCHSDLPESNSTAAVDCQPPSVPKVLEPDVICIASDSDDERAQPPRNTSEKRIPSVVGDSLPPSSTDKGYTRLRPAITFPCNQCRRRMHSNIAFLRHKVRFHTEGVTAYYNRCEICLELIFKRHFKQHISQHTSANDHLHRCVLCQGYFYGRSRMLMHYIKSHNLFDVLTRDGSAAPPLKPILVPPRQDTTLYRSPAY